ncbi:MAG: DUF2202 domain-containing protein [Spirochaetales bacterium]|nr:DUF2202 domain-containing protein [Spirochaetales bacterium]
MKKIFLSAIVIFMITTTAVSAFADDSRLTMEEQQGILQMREEEKLARDVYLALYDTWNIPIFKNIAASEQSHMDAVKTLITEYRMEDPVAVDVRGVFKNAELQKLYNDLTTLGKKDAVSAVTVGARVEELDIFDLENLMAQTSKSDILAVYENLVKGSRNHLRSFYSQIQGYGADFSPEYITVTEFYEIISGSAERGRR